MLDCRRSVGLGSVLNKAITASTSDKNMDGEYLNSKHAQVLIANIVRKQPNRMRMERLLFATDLFCRNF